MSAYAALKFHGIKPGQRDAAKTSIKIIGSTIFFT